VNLVGANNKVTYKKAKEGDAAKVTIVGTENVVEKVGAPPAATPSTAPTTTATTATAGTTIDCAKTPSFSYDDNGGTFTFTGKCDKIAINGNDAKLTIESVKALALPGNNNTATVTAADLIATPGNNNTVTYKKAATANAKVKISNPGNGNRIKLVK
jgi:hypothetical protein